LATDNFGLSQVIEADMVPDFAWGTSNAQPVTLSFWVNSSLTGTFSGALRSYPTPSTRGYPFTYSIPSANTWTKIAITIPGDTNGTWVLQGNAGSLQVLFDLGSGANFRFPAGAWANGNIWGATGSVSVVAVNTATFYVTGVKLEIGSVATPFNRQSLAKSLADCQRYYQNVQLYFAGQAGTASQGLTFSNMTPVALRASATATMIANNNSNIAASPTITGNVNSLASIAGTAVAAGAYTFNVYFSLSAEL
jgi:hypothetical protein